MKIIDFDKRGNLVRFFLGDDDCDDYHGDDWNDTPYEHNAGLVYEEYVKDYIDVVFPYDFVVAEPSEDWRFNNNSQWCKDDMKDRKVPCIIAARMDEDHWYRNNEFGYWLGKSDTVRIYFGDDPHSLMKYDCIIIRPPKNFVQEVMDRRAQEAQEEDLDEN